MRYTVVYADPPWQYRDRRDGRNGTPTSEYRWGGAEAYYPTLSLDQVCALPVPEIAAPDSFLFLWATFPQLDKALTVLEAWGYRYITQAFTWVKVFKSGKPFSGLGHYTAPNSEVCLLGLKGKPKVLRHGISSVILCPPLGHSRKPPEVRDRIVALAGDVPRIELFAREKPEGWDTWGNQCECSIRLSNEKPQGQKWLPWG